MSASRLDEIVVCEDDSQNFVELTASIVSQLRELRWRGLRVSCGGSLNIGATSRRSPLQLKRQFAYSEVIF